MAFAAMMFVGIALLLFALGIGEIILGIVLRIITSKRIKKGFKKPRALSVISVLSFVFGVVSLLPLTFMLSFILYTSYVPNSIVIEGITYRSGFYGELYPAFGQAGDIGSNALKEGIIYKYRTHEFQRVDFEEHDWVHSYIGPYTSGTVYCADNQWEQMSDYYANPNNFKYYYGVGYYISETSVHIPEIDLQKFDELLTFGNINRSSIKAQRISQSEFQEGICFYKVSNDGFFMTSEGPMYFVHDGKLMLVLYHDAGTEEVVAVNVPDELGQYFIGLIDK